MVGTERTLSFYGHSTIAGPAFSRLAQIFAEGGETEDIVCATLSFERLQWGRKQLRFEENLSIKVEELTRLAKSRLHGLGM